jgi:hypothetical protein
MREQKDRTLTPLLSLHLKLDCKGSPLAADDHPLEREGSDAQFGRRSRALAKKRFREKYTKAVPLPNFVQEVPLRKLFAFSVLVLLLILAIPSPIFSFADDETSAGVLTANPDPASPPTPPGKKSGTSFDVGLGVKVSTLGIGGEVAVSVTPRSNVRVGFNAFNYNHTFNKDNVTYKGSLDLRSVQATWDVFPWGGFHLSPGVLLYNGNKINATANVPGGQNFTLNGINYLSDPTNPVSGTGKLQINKAAPMILLGFGNLVPRSNRHFSLTTEFGAAYQGAPRTTLNLSGSVCDPTGLLCRSISSDPTVLANIQMEQAKIDKSASPFRFYPIFSFGFGWKF